ncbi:MAG: serine/threonine protein kinase [Myxococcales bacterium]|nr:serine/threonine protein kinase [Myxococcales bacterium]
MEIERSTRCLATSEVIWALLSPPEALLWLVGLDDVLPGQSETTVCDLQEPSRFSAPAVVEQPLTVREGSITDATIVVELTEVGELGVDVKVSFRCTPRRSWTEFLTTPRLQRFFEARLERQLQDVREALSGRQQHYPAAPPLPDASRARVTEAFQTAPHAARDAVVSRLLRAPLAVQSVLRPAEIAAVDDLPIADVLQTLILGVQRGVLEIEWAVLCPQSRSAAADGKRIYEQGLHCAACGVRYATGLYDSMELVFRPRQALRPDRVTIDRLIHGRTPKPVNKHRLDLRQSLEFTQDLEAGRYLVETGSGTLVLDVAPEHSAVPLLRLVLGRDDPALSAHVPPGRQRFEIVNPLTHVEQIRVSRRWRPPFALTATTLYSFPPTRHLLPAALLAPECEVFHGAVMVVDCDDAQARKRVQAVLRATTAPELVTRDGNTVVAGFRQVADVLVASEQMAARQLLVGVGIGVGLVNVLKGWIRGPASDLATEALAQAGRPQYAVHEASVPVLEGALEEHGRVISLRDRPGRSALMVFAAVVDGAPELDVDDFTPVGAPEREFTELTSVAGFPIVGSLDRGGVGEVLEVEDPATGRHLAAKVLHPHLASQRFIQLFHKEGYYASQLHHPNIVESLDWGEEDGRPYLLMELLQGHTLYKEVRRVAPLSLKRTAEVMGAVLAALEAIHAKGWVHRDIKPHNIFLLEEPGDVPHGVKLLDFGLMRPAGRSQNERFAGTPEFMAPEQVELGDVDARSDLYAVGALAFFTHTGKPPFRGRTRGEGAVLRMDGSVPDELDPEVLGPLTPIVEKALRFEREARWPDAASMGAAMEQLAATLDE